MDMFIIRPLAEYGLMRQDVVMGMEVGRLDPLLMLNGPGSDDGNHPVGLCNAVILARPGAEFLKRWMATYEDGFHALYWSYNSVVSSLATSVSYS
jgi:hypothetical protein